jgi:tripeptide aminopeptidase
MSLAHLPVDRVLDLAREIQQIPAPTFAEERRADFVETRFKQEGLQDVHRDHLGNVYGRLPGDKRKKPLVVTAHLDTVFPLDVDLSVQKSPGKICGPGIGDNALGVAGLVGLIWSMRAGGATLPMDLLLVGTVGEEGLGNSRGMRAVVDRLGDQALAYLALEGMALGHVFNQGMAVRRFEITCRTGGGHSWVDYGKPSAIHEIAGLISDLKDLDLPGSPRTTWNAGLFSGGISVNTIAPEASVEIDLRSESEAVLTDLEGTLFQLVDALTRPGVDLKATLVGERPAGSIDPGHPLVDLACNSLELAGVEPHLSIGSTDTSIPLHLGYPAICLGLTTGAGAHTIGEYINTLPLAQGLEQLMNVVLGAFDALTARPA